MADVHVSVARRILGWLVHAFTASGLLCAAGVVMLLLQNERTPETYRYCFMLMLVAFVIDGVDGTFARWVRIREAVPSFNGRRLDDLVDFLMYTCLPLLLIERTGLLPEGWGWVLIVALVSSTYGFCQEGIKSSDGSFVGFPSYWNVIAYYCYAVSMPGWLSVSLVLFFSVMTFVPNHYPYPTQPGRLNRLLLITSIPWAILLLFDVLRPWTGRELPRWEVLASMVYPAFYLIVGWWRSEFLKLLKPRSRPHESDDR